MIYVCSNLFELNIWILTILFYIEFHRNCIKYIIFKTLTMLRVKINATLYSLYMCSNMIAYAIGTRTPCFAGCTSKTASTACVRTHRQNPLIVCPPIQVDFIREVSLALCDFILSLLDRSCRFCYNNSWIYLSKQPNRNAHRLL